MNSGIEWTDATWNPVRGCSRVSEGCRNCYAERVAARFSKPGQPYHGFAQVVAPRDLLDAVGGRRNGWTRKVALVQEHLADPLKWRKPRRIFVNSMSDLFHEALTNEEIAAVFGVMAACPRHTFQVLTKRARRMREWFEWVNSTAVLDGNAGAWCIQHTDDEYPGILGDRVFLGVPWPLPNVWLGVSIENQDAADERIPELLATPAAVRFLSCEPLLGPVDLRKWVGRPARCTTVEPCAACNANNGTLCRFSSGLPDLHWLIAGCESGPGARSIGAEEFRSLRDQCAAAGVPFFLKQAVKHTAQRAFSGGMNAATVMIEEITAGPGSHRKPGGIIGAPYLDGRQHLEIP